MIKICDLLGDCEQGYMVAVEIETVLENEDLNNPISIRYYHNMQEDEVVWLVHLLRQWNDVGWEGSCQVVGRHPPPGTMESRLPMEEFSSEEEQVLGSLGLGENTLIAYSIVESYFIEEANEDLTHELTDKWRDYAS